MLTDLLDIDTTDPLIARAIALAESDRLLVRELIMARQAARLTQTEVAARLGISQPSVAAFERSDNDPKLSSVRRYALAVGAHVAHEVTTPAEVSLPAGWRTVSTVALPSAPPTMRPAALTQSRPAPITADFGLAA